MSKPKVIIVGSSGHSKVVIDIIEKEGEYEIIGLLDSFRQVGSETLGYKVLGKEEDLPGILSENKGVKIFIAIGDNWTRRLVKDKIVAIVPDVEFAKAVHPSAQIGKNVVIGEGTAVMACAVVNSDTSIGAFAIVNTKASIDHDSVMGDFSSLAPGVTTGGRVSLGSYAAVSIGATIKQGVVIGSHALVGAGALLLNNCADNTIVYGVPAKEIRKREIGEKYL